MSKQTLSRIKDTLDVGCWNIQGLYHRSGTQRPCKLNEPEQKYTIAQTDLFALTETHCSPLEDIQLRHFKVVNNTRKKHKNMKNKNQ